MAAWIKERRSRLTADKPAMEALKLRRLELQCDILQREKDEAHARLIPADRYEQLIVTHLGDLRQQVKNLLLLELPATLSGLSTVEIRESNQKAYHSLCRRLQHAAAKLSVPGRPLIEASPASPDSSNPPN